MRVQRFLVGAVLCLSAAGSVGADEASDPLQRAMTYCQEDFGDERCNDADFLRQNYLPDDNNLKQNTANHTSGRRKREEDRALRELLLQRLCSQDLKKFCKADGSPDCLARTGQMCTLLKEDAAACAISAKQTCATHESPDCYKHTVAHCPTAKKEKIEVLLAKYPKLTQTQQARLIDTAAKIDATSGNLLGKVLRWLGLNI